MPPPISPDKKKRVTHSAKGRVVSTTVFCKCSCGCLNVLDSADLPLCGDCLDGLHPAQ